MARTKAPVAPTSRAEVVYTRLKGEIVHGRVAPGSPLTEIALAERLGISRTPVREALRRLHEDGLVNIEHGRGARVSEVSLREAVEVYEIRELIEPYAGRVVAGSLRPEVAESLRAIRKVLAAPSLTADPSERWQLDCKLHDLVLEAAGNVTAREFIWTLRMRTERAFTYLAKRGLDLTQHEHLDLIDAILRGDGSSAESLTRSHLANARQRLTERGGALAMSTGEASPSRGRKRRAGGIAS